MSDVANAKEEDVSYLDEGAGLGFEDVDSSSTAVPMLLISQQLSQVVQDGKIEAGHFYNSISGKDYGTEIKVVVVSFKKCWIEWKPNGGGFVARHEVGAVPVTGDNFTGMKTAEGNTVVETWMYLCILPDHTEDGYVLFQSTRGNIRYLKGWNTQMRFLKLPSGKPAPIYGAMWLLKLGADKNKSGQRYFSCNEAGKSSITRVGWVSKQLLESDVLPARDSASFALEKADVAAIEGPQDASAEEETEF